MNEKKIKIFFLIETLEMGGAEKLLVDVLKKLDRKKYSPVAGCLLKRQDMSEELKAAGVPVYCLGLKSEYCWPEAVYKLYRIMRKENFDLVHTHLYFANIYGRIAAKLSGVRHIVSTLHNADYSNEDNGKFSYLIRKMLDRYTGKWCNQAFIAVSDHVKRDFQKHLRFDNIEIIYNCLDFSKIVEKDTEVSLNTRRRLGIGKSDPVLLNIARFHPQKGQKYLLEAFSLTLKDFPGAWMIIVGKGELEDELKSMACRLKIDDRVIFLKNRSDVPSLMSCADVFLLPSVYEGLSIAQIEAMASGLPVVGSNIEAISVITRDRHEGLLVRPKDPEDISYAVARILKDPELKFSLGENARSRAKSMFDIEIHLKNLDKFYTKLLGRTCLVCKRQRQKKSIYGGYHHAGKDYYILRCPACGFMFVDPLPERSVLEEIYAGNEYFQSYYATKQGVKGYIEAMSERNGIDEKTLRLINKFKSGEDLLDIGCSAGNFLANAKNKGFKVQGIEPNPEMAAYAVNSLGLTVHCGTLESFSSAKKFDIVHAADVLEHLSNLEADMQIIGALLKDNGILVINQPLMYNKSLFNVFLKLNMLFKSNKLSQNPPLHLWEFTPGTLKIFLENYGFRVLYRRISESKAKPLVVNGRASLKNLLYYHSKNISSFFSNCFLFKWLLLGDRGFFICQKTG